MAARLQFMGTAVISALAGNERVPEEDARRYLDFAALQQVNFARHMQTPSGLFFHGMVYFEVKSFC